LALQDDIDVSGSLECLAGVALVEEEPAFDLLFVTQAGRSLAKLVTVYAVKQKSCKAAQSR
jgi:hypothetical protein